MVPPTEIIPLLIFDREGDPERFNALKVEVGLAVNVAATPVRVPDDGVYVNLDDDTVRNPIGPDVEVESAT